MSTAEIQVNDRQPGLSLRDFFPQMTAEQAENFLTLLTKEKLDALRKTIMTNESLAKLAGGTDKLMNAFDSIVTRSKKLVQALQKREHFQSSVSQEGVGKVLLESVKTMLIAPVRNPFLTAAIFAAILYFSGRATQALSWVRQKFTNIPQELLVGMKGLVQGSSTLSSNPRESTDL